MLWKTAVGIHNGHDHDDQLALEGKLRLKTPYTLYSGEVGGVETNMAAADGVAYVPVVNLPTTYRDAKAILGLPHVAQAVVRQRWTDVIGLGRMMLSYPTILAEAVEKGTLAAKSICRTFSDCTTAPRNGLISVRVPFRSTRLPCRCNPV